MDGPSIDPDLVGETIDFIRLIVHTVNVGAVGGGPPYQVFATFDVTWQFWSGPDPGLQTVSDWATAVSPGPLNESAQAVNFLVTNDNNALFMIQPEVSPTGTLIYRPATDANGTATVTVRVQDDGGTANGGVDTSAPQTFTITVTPVNDAPVAEDDSYSIGEATPLNVASPGVLENDRDVDGDVLTAVLESGPSNGVLTLNADGSFVYLPNIEFRGTDSFTYRASDASVNSNLATVTIRVANPVAFVVERGSDRVALIDENLTIFKEILVGAFPTTMAVTPDGKRLYVTLTDDDKIAVIDVPSQTLVETFDAVNYAPWGIDITPDGQFAYVSNSRDDTVSVFRLSDNALVETISDSAFGTPHGVAITPDGSFAYVANIFGNPDNVTVIDTATNSVVAAVDVSPFIHRYGPWDVTILPDGTKAYSNDGDDGQSVFAIDTDPASLTFNQLVATIPIGTDENGPRGMDSGETLLGTRVFAGLAESGEVVVIDPDTDQIVQRVSTGANSFPWRLRLNPAGTQLFVSLRKDDEVLVLDTTTYAEITRIPGFDTPADILFLPDDGDNVPAAVEDGAPNGGDGNSDGTPDSRQSNVTSLPNAVDATYVTLAAPTGTGFSLVSAVANPSPGDAPANVGFPVGFFQFTLEDVTPGGATTVTQFFESPQTFDTYYKYGPEPGNPTNHWYEFLYDGTTGAEILADRIVLHFVDGQRGDDDLTANGKIVEPGGPGFLINEPPTADAGGPYAIDEGASLTLDASNSDDPDGDTLSFTWDVNGDNVFGDAVGETATLTAAQLQALGIADDGSFTVTVKVDDGRGETDTASTTLTVNNVAPDNVDIDASVGELVFAVGSTETFAGSFTDPGTLDTHTAVWTFSHVAGLSTVTETRTGAVAQGAGSGTVSNDFSFTDAGVYTVTLTVQDDDTGETTSTDSIFVVYDPSEGFVTGGGWIHSPVGAYYPDPGLTGKANFGFVSKYKNGATVPTGQTEFQFKVADLNFHSTEYEWLVVAGARAQYKGSGTINGGGNYGFMLTAIDGQINGGGGVDKFRIKIWDKDYGDGIVYDNGLGGPDDDTPPTALGGGNVIIHKNGNALHAAGGANHSGQAASLDEIALRTAVDQAITQWAVAGADPRHLAELSGVQVQVADLSGSLLGVSSAANMIWIDRDAAGYGWSLDVHAGAAGRMDLISVVSHELGHLLGRDHAAHDDDVMGARLSLGARRLPVADHHHDHDADQHAVFDPGTHLSRSSFFGTALTARHDGLAGDWRADGDGQPLSGWKREPLAHRAAVIDLVFRDGERGLLDRTGDTSPQLAGGGGDDELDLLSGEEAELIVDADTGTIDGRL